MNVSVRPAAVRMPLDDLVLELELQPRALLDRGTWEEYLYLLGDGVELPPVVAFNDGEKHWLADGYHRWHAHKEIEATDIAVQVFPGSREEALRFSLRANAAHGKRREPGDYARSYAIAVKHGFVQAADTDAVRETLQCSMRCAYDLTEVARKKIEVDRDAEIAAKKAAGKSNRTISKETGIPRATVNRHVPGSNSQPAEVSHPAPEPGQALFDKMTSPAGERWWGALRALQKIAQQASVQVMMEDRYDGIPSSVFDPALIEAHAWINELHARYFDE